MTTTSRRTGALLAAAGLLIATGCSDTSNESSEVGDTAAVSTIDDVDPVASCGDGEPAGTDDAAIAAAVGQLAADMDLRSVMYRVTRDDELVAAGNIGESLTGVPVEPTMQFRVGNVAFGYMGTLLLLFAEEGLVELDDPISAWLPNLDVPNADTVTLEMLVRNTSGYPDYVGADAFEDAFSADPFQDFPPQRLLDIAFDAPPYYEPGTSWNYAHTNYVLLGQALERIGGDDLGALLLAHVIEPLGLADTAPAATSELPGPVLHTYSTERGPFEETTYWNPSWQTAPGGIVTSDLCDLTASATAIGSGALLDDASYETFLDDSVIDLGPPPDTCPEGACPQLTSDRYYGFGVLVFNGWVAQVPLFGGSGGVNAHLPDEAVTVAIQTVAGPGSDPDTNHAMAIWSEIADRVTPDSPPIG